MNSFRARIGRIVTATALALAAPAFIATPMAPAFAAPQKSDVKTVAGALRAIKTMKADFVQVGRGGQRLTGKMTLKRPGKIRFQYQDDVPVLLVSDGHRLTMLDYEVSQKQVWPVKDSPLGALLDPDGDVEKYGKLMPTGHPDVVSLRIKDPKHPEYGTLTLIFQRKANAPGGMELGSWVAVDAQNKVTKVFLENHRYNMAISDNMFRYKDVSSRKKR